MIGSNPGSTAHISLGIAMEAAPSMTALPMPTALPVPQDTLLTQKRPAIGETIFRCASLALILGTLTEVAFDAAYPDHRHAVTVTEATMHSVFGGITALVVLFHLLASLRTSGWQAVAMRVLDVVALESYLILLWTSWR
jgi:hypothetical protein